ERALLPLVDRQILQHDLVALPIEFLPPAGRHGGKLMGQRPELVAAGLRLRCDAVIDLEAPFALGVDAGLTVAGLPAAAAGPVVDEEIAGRAVFRELPAIEDTLVRAEFRIGARRRDAAHVARHAHGAAATGELDLGILRHRRVPDR